MNRNELKELLMEKIIILDGATGTALAKSGMPAGVCVEQWALANQDKLVAIQKEYYESGSDAVYTCTFGGNAAKLDSFGIEDCENLNYELAKVSKKINPNKLVAGSIGPTGEMALPFGTKTADDFKEYFTPQIKGLVRGGVDFLVFETMIDIRELRYGVLAAKELCDLPIVTTLSVDEHGKTLGGTPFATALITLTSLGVDAVGLNCSCGPLEMLKILEDAKPYVTVPLVAKPNAGMPQIDDVGNTYFSMDADSFSSYAQKFANVGVCMTGGCCGTDSSFIAMVSQKLKDKKASTPQGNIDSFITSARDVYKIEGQLDNVVICDEFLADTVMDDFMDCDYLTIKAEKPEDAEYIEQLTGMVNIPLIFDCSDEVVLSEILRRYPGRAGVVNGSKMSGLHKYGIVNVDENCN